MTERKNDRQIRDRVELIRREFQFAYSVRLMGSQLLAMYDELRRLQRDIGDDLGLWEEIEELMRELDNAMAYHLDHEGNYRGKSLARAPGAHMIYR